VNDASNDIQWGPAIVVDGKRPGWLKDGDKIRWYSSNMGDAWWDNLSHRGYVPVGRLAFDRESHSIRLPADHPHYRQTEVAPIDWSGELEAVHEDGRVVRVTVAKGPDKDGDREVMPQLDEVGRLFGKDGTPWSNNGWRIRNVAQPTPQADTKPDLTARMRALATRIADNWSLPPGPVWGKEAQAIAVELADPVDDDLLEARQAVAEMKLFQDVALAVLAGDYDDQPIVVATLEAVRGRALALAGEKEA